LRNLGGIKRPRQPVADRPHHVWLGTGDLFADHAVRVCGSKPGDYKTLILKAIGNLRFPITAAAKSRIV